MKNKQPDWLRAVGVASSAGFTLFSCIGLGVFLGYQGDLYFDTSPWGVMIGGFLGSIAGFYSIYIQIAGRE